MMKLKASLTNLASRYSRHSHLCFKDLSLVIVDSEVISGHRNSDNVGDVSTNGIVDQDVEL